MKKKKGSLRKLTAMPAAASVFALAASAAHAQTPVFDATFPTSWNAATTTVTDQSGAGNVGFQNGTATYSTTAVPSWATPGTGSMALSGAGGIKITGNGTTFPTDAILNNTAIAADGGFTFNLDFMWNGSGSGTEKLLDYSGTESLQLTSITANSATLGMAFDTGDTSSTGADPGTDVDVVSTTIQPNVWYNVTLIFNTEGNSLVGKDISGIAGLYVDDSLVSSAATTKGAYGDSLNRPIAIGELGYGHTSAYVGFDGDVYSASVDLGVEPAPEPSTVSLALLGGFGMMGMMWKSRRQKAL